MSNDKKWKYADAFQELLKNQPFDKVNVSDICERCGTFRANFYYHFKNKEELVRWIFEQDIEESKLVSQDFAARQSELFRIMKRRSAFYLKALEDGFMGTYIDSSMKLLIIEFFGANADSITDEDIFKLRYIVSGCLMTIFEWMAGKIDASEEELAEKICTTMDKLYRAKI